MTLAHLFGEELHEIVDGVSLPVWIEYDWDHLPWFMEPFRRWSQDYWRARAPLPVKHNAVRYGKGSKPSAEWSWR